jgi:hypothetical protein
MHEIFLEQLVHFKFLKISVQIAFFKARKSSEKKIISALLQFSLTPKDSKTGPSQNF